MDFLMFFPVSRSHGAFHPSLKPAIPGYVLLTVNISQLLVNTVEYIKKLLMKERSFSGSQLGKCKSKAA